jgi:ribosomal protein S15P/S13E
MQYATENLRWLLGENTTVNVNDPLETVTIMLTTYTDMENHVEEKYKDQHEKAKREIQQTNAIIKLIKEPVNMLMLRYLSKHLKYLGNIGKKRYDLTPPIK